MNTPSVTPEQALSNLYQQHSFSDPSAKELREWRQFATQEVYSEFLEQGEKALEQIKLTMGILNVVAFTCHRNITKQDKASKVVKAVARSLVQSPQRIEFALGGKRPNGNLYGACAIISRNWGIEVSKYKIKQVLPFLEELGIFKVVPGRPHQSTELEEIDLLKLLITYEAFENLIVDHGEWISQSYDDPWETLLPRHRGVFMVDFFNVVLGRLLGWFRRKMRRDEDGHFWGFPTMCRDKFAAWPVKKHYIPKTPRLREEFDRLVQVLISRGVGNAIAEASRQFWYAF